MRTRREGSFVVLAVGDGEDERAKVGGIEGAAEGEQLVEYDAKRPDIRLDAVRLRAEEAGAIPSLVSSGHQSQPVVMEGSQT